MKEVNVYKDVAILAQGKIVFADMATERVDDSPVFSFQYELTRGVFDAKPGEVVNLNDIQRHFDVFTDGIGFSRS